jgi:sulfatase modifying factor 1
MRAPAFAACAVLFVGCGDPPATVDATAAASSAVTAAPDSAPSAVVSEVVTAHPRPCPDDMLYVDTDFCADPDRRCTDIEHERINHLDICHAFAREQRCRGEPRRIAFCIDRYEYPNRYGAHPVWMLDWYEAQATCSSKGKRLCWSSEWTGACEGPEHTPFPYGYERDHRACNIDNFFIDPMRPGPRAQFFFYSKDEGVARRELSRLDQSVRSGSIETCRSGFGVYDMTGNLDEWVISDEPPKDKSKWAGLKGGAWGHVRSQCRPMTTSHEPEFYYYFVGFRCCRDAVGTAQWTPSPQAFPPPVVKPHDFAPDPIVVVDPPGPSKTKFTWVPKRE